MPQPGKKLTVTRREGARKRMIVKSLKHPCPAAHRSETVGIWATPLKTLDPVAATAVRSQTGSTISVPVSQSQMTWRLESNVTRNKLSAGTRSPGSSPRSFDYPVTRKALIT
jgi:hypothetical protein